MEIRKENYIMEYRSSMEINDQWESIMWEETGKPEEVLRNKAWEKVRIPHNWENYHGYHRVSHGNLHGTAWYRRSLSYQEAWKGKRVFLLFEGVGAYADVWLNGNYVGGHKGGRTCFSLDITEELKEGEENLLLVRARHPEKIKDLPWICGGCFGTPNSEGSQPLGIFRPVHIQVTGGVRVKPFGVCITTPEVSTSQAKVQVESELVNISDQPLAVEAMQELLDENGRILACVKQEVQLAPREELTVCQLLKDIRGIQLWFPETPVLYRMRTRILAEGQELDCVENTFGFRQVEWENFVSNDQDMIDQEKIKEEPGEENQNFVSYLRGGENSEVAIVPGGVKVRISEFSPERVLISIDTVIKNQTDHKHEIQVEAFVQTYNRTKSIASLLTKTEIYPGETIVVTQKCDPLSFPDLWSEENPVLHNVISTVRGIDEDLKEYCQAAAPFRICDCKGLANKANAFVSREERGEKVKRRLLVNGRPYFLNGSCEYEHELGNDHAFTGEMIQTRMEMFEAAGFNAFREAHCPHNLRYLDYCDKKGIFYWAQMGAHIYFDRPDFRRNFLALTEEWLKERRNSPSLILWSIQNESMLPSEFTAKVTALIHRLDVTSPNQRKVVTCNGGTGSDWNIPQNWSGTYGGSVENYGKEAMEMCLIGEYGQYRVKGKHQEGDMEQHQNSGGDVSEELFAYCLETKVREGEKVRDYFYGHFQWIFVTHANPGRELLYCLDGKGTNGVGVVNSKGIFTSWGEPTDVYYMYRANYTLPEKDPMVYLVSHSWPDRFTAPGRGDITVYSNCDYVELYNDYGEKPVGREEKGGKGEHFTFKQVMVSNGVLTAKGYYQGKCVAVDRIFFPALPLPVKRKREEVLSIEASEKDLYRVNCGGDNYLDEKGFWWSKDRKYQEGSFGWRSWGMDFDNVEDEIGSFGESFDEVENIEEQGLFQNFRYGREKLSYHFPADDGKYAVELYFAEPWYGAAGEKAEGWRVFDVSVNGETINRLDIFKEAGGANIAVKKSLEVQSVNGMIDLTFPKVYSNQAVIYAIRIIRRE